MSTKLESTRHDYIWLRIGAYASIVSYSIPTTPILRIGQRYCSIEILKTFVRTFRNELQAKGDIITIVNDDSLTAGIILRQPLSEEEMAIRFDAHRSEMLETIDPNSETAEWRIYDYFPYDYKDDCYEALLFVDNGSLAKKTIPSSRVIPSVYANLPISYHHAEIIEEAFRNGQ